MLLNEKVCLVTGAASGIGRAIAERCAQEGAAVLLADVNPAGEELAAGLRVAGARARFCRTDMTQAVEVEQLVAAAEAEFGRLDALFNVVGGSGRQRGDGPVHTCTEEAWHYVLDLNLKSVFLAAKYAIPALRRAAGGAIVNIASVLGLVGDERFATHAYAASKGGVLSLTRAMAIAYAPERIRVNALCPGLIATPMSERAQGDPEIRAALPQLMPLTGQFGRPEQVAAAAVFLASDEAALITGVVLPVDAGWTAR